MGDHVDPVAVARRMIGLGFVVIPLAGKKPIPKWRKHQYLESRPTNEQLLEEVRKNATSCNSVAILHGETNRTICVDADSAEDRDGLFAAVPDAPWKVLSGKGGHVLFSPPPGIDQKSIRQAIGCRLELPNGTWVKVDIKPQGGYSVAPGSWHGGKKRPYLEVEPWRAGARLPVLSAATKIEKTRSHNGKTYTETKTVAEWASDYEAGIKAAASRMGDKDLEAMTLAHFVIEQQFDDQTPRTPERTKILERVKKYLLKCAPAVEGQGGNTHTFKVCCSVVSGFSLNDYDALEALDAWNNRCEPPWQPRDLLRKIWSARNDGRSVAPGSKLKQRRASPDEGRSENEDHREEPSPDIEDTRPRDDRPRRTIYKRYGAARLRSADLRRILEFAKANEGHFMEGHRKLAKRLRGISNCMTLCSFAECVGRHGPKGAGHRPCDDVIGCTTCATRGANLLEEHVSSTWPENVWWHRTECAKGSALAAADAWKGIKEKIRPGGKGKDPLPRFEAGDGRVDSFFPEFFDGMTAEALVLSYWPDAKLITRAEAGRIAAETWYSVHELFLALLHDDKTSLLDLIDFSWFTARKHRTGGGAKACKQLPWTNVDLERKKNTEAWKKEHPGLERDECDTIVEVRDGKPVFCGCKMHYTLTYSRTGKLLGKKRGAFREDEELKALTESNAEREWLETLEPHFSVADP